MGIFGSFFSDYVGEGPTGVVPLFVSGNRVKKKDKIYIKGGKRKLVMRGDGARRGR